MNPTKNRGELERKGPRNIYKWNISVVTCVTDML